MPIVGFANKNKVTNVTDKRLLKLIVEANKLANNKFIVTQVSVEYKKWFFIKKQYYQYNIEYKLCLDDKDWDGSVQDLCIPCDYNSILNYFTGFIGGIEEYLKQ